MSEKIMKSRYFIPEHAFLSIPVKFVPYHCVKLTDEKRVF